MSNTGWVLLILGIGAFIAIIVGLIVLHIDNQAEHESTRDHIEGTRKHISSSSSETHDKLDDLKKAVADKWKSITKPGNRW